MSAVSKVFSASLDGLDAKLIEIETDVHVGLHSFNIVGLADKSLSEARERVNSALKNSGVKPPNKENRKIVVNLAPADLKKAGSHYDLGIAIGYLLATGQMKDFDTKKKLFIGELALDGSLRAVDGVLSIAEMAKAKKFSEVVLPEANAAEAAMIKGLKVTPVKNLSQAMLYLEDREKISHQPETEIVSSRPDNLGLVDIADVKGQENAKRALMIAAAGNHNIFMQGTPGAGKTMLAQTLVSILPPPSAEEILEITKIYSAAKLLGDFPYIGWRPFRSPHHTASTPAIIGGGQNPRPGEISLAHRGVLFLDELPEFHRDVLESLRQPMESGLVTVSRAKDNLTFPSRFLLAAAMNPCPCGFYGDEEKECRCLAFEVMRYQKKISGPLLDRIDIQINVPRVKIEELQNKKRNEEAAKNLRRKIKTARQRQEERFKKLRPKIFTNSELSSRQCDELLEFNQEADAFLKDMFEKSLISARGYYRILKLGRTIADLEDSDEIKMGCLAEAFQYRLRENT